MPVIPAQYEYLSGTKISKDPIFADLPEIASYGSGRNAVCSVQFKKGNVYGYFYIKKVEDILYGTSKSSEEFIEDWVVVSGD